MNGEREAMTVVIQRLRDAASSLLQAAEDLERITAVEGTETANAEQDVTTSTDTKDEREVNAAKYDGAAKDNRAIDEQQLNADQAADRSMQSTAEQGRGSSPELPTLAEILSQTQSQKRIILGLRTDHHELKAAKDNKIGKDVGAVNATKRRAVEEVGPAYGTKRRATKNTAEVDRTKSTDVIDLTNVDSDEEEQELMSNIDEETTLTPVRPAAKIENRESNTLDRMGNDNKSSIVVSFHAPDKRWIKDDDNLFTNVTFEQCAMDVINVSNCYMKDVSFQRCNFAGGVDAPTCFTASPRCQILPDCDFRDFMWVNEDREKYRVHDESFYGKRWIDKKTPREIVNGKDVF